MKVTFWARRFLAAFCVAFLVIAGAQLLKGRTLEYAVSEGLLWSFIAATLFTVAAVYRWRRGIRCAVCGDPPEAVEPTRGPQAP